MAAVKITVVKKLTAHDLYGDTPPMDVARDFVEDCPRFAVGDEFVTEDGSCPTGFCAWAFADIQRDITHLRFDGNYPWAAKEGEALACCTDGLRPVFFKLERVK